MRSWITMVFLSFALFLCSIAPAQEAMPSPASGSVVVPQVEQQAMAAPAEWMKDAAVKVYSLPYVGPIVLMIFKVLNALLIIVTALCGFLLVTFKALSTILSAAKLTEWAALVTNFKDNSKVMYWLKYISAFNAPAPKEDSGQIKSNT